MQKEQVMNHANVIIVGGDHHNGLNLARAFGIHGVTVYAMIVEKKLKKSYIGKSKYIKKYCIFQTEKDAFDDISCRGYEEGTFIIPYSDGAAQELDRRLDEFKKRFTVPSIRGKQGAIADLMAKNAQVKFAKAHDIKMADSFLLDLSKNGVDIPNGWNDFPCILKPNISANGNKLDIVVCNNKEELTEKLNILKEKDYPNILLQKFLNIDYEVVVVGAIYQNHDEIDYAVHRVIRKYPDTAGTNSFSCLVTEKGIIDKCGLLLKKIKDFGFCGLIDVEAFIVNDDIILNEINWRNSGGGFRAYSTGFYYPFRWYSDMMGQIIGHNDWKPVDDCYSMVEYTDIRHVFEKRLSLHRWLADRKKTSNFALKYKGDMKPFFYKYIYHFMGVSHKSTKR